MACEHKPCSIKSCQMLPDVVTTEQQSLLLVKKLLAIAVSSITYLRGLFPEKAYGTKYVGELKVLILREQSCPGAQQIVHWLQGCFDALQQRYLRMVILSIYCDPENPQKVTECYQFKIRYTEKGPQMDFESKNGQSLSTMAGDNTQKSSMLLVRKLYMLVQNLGPLPDNVCLNMKLFYYDQVTPQEYQPPGFKEDDSGTLVFERESVKLTMGQVDTPFHSLRLNVTTERRRLESVDDDVEVCGSTKCLLFEDEVMSQTTVQQEDMTKENVISDAGIEYSESSQQAQTRNKEVPITNRKEKLQNSPQMDNLVKKTADLMRDARKSQSIRNIEAQMSKFEFPLSQDPQPSAPKRRKFSVPK
ncbi:HORMA domain-containing protein 1 [Misgurnus anguillicaudatus]|uniref:HORMA domain-containing protein 1 n=1 Tax=Misgurnus anguillicaudatus TaxID=75329 RepID=UPI00243481E5|nr:HORMA domain-containing protein 1 [Misgurnus anguillicaudatus]XP_055066227.1 HORMA domain-containing protein 1 [Misgurnus anguillicaudatus]XP_055066228.1 HORMA domain-containing protein 1 [Misgurnus anguillicaudatus]